MKKLLLHLLAACIAPSLLLAASSPAVFSGWPEGTSPEVIGKKLSEKFVAGPHGNVDGRKRDMIIYPETCAWYGALTFAALTHDKPLSEKLAARFEPMFGPEASLIPAPIHVDYTVFGTVPLELYIETKDQRYLDVGLRLADAQWQIPTPEQLTKLNPRAKAAAEESLANSKDVVGQGLTWQTRFWIDDMYMITIVQTQAYRATGDKKYIDRAALEAVAYLRKLQQPNGLFYHAPDVPYFWGRGNGWFAVGMAELLRSLPEDHPQRAEILASYRKMMATLLKYQDADGMWHQLVDRPESWAETSGTGMFTFAFITGVKNGWLDEATYGQPARKGWLALVAHLNPDGSIRDVCEGTNKKNDYQYYLDRKRVTGDLHGQAPVLWCASALLR